MIEHEIEISEWPFSSNENEKMITSRGNILKQFFLG